MQTFYPDYALPAVQPIEDKEPRITASVRSVLLKLARGTAEPDSFTSEARAKLFPDQAKQIGETLNSLSLPIAIIHMSELVDRRDENGLRIYRYAMHDLGKSLFCTVTLTTDDKIAGLQLSLQ